MAAVERFVDQLPTDTSYAAQAARSYDAFMPPGTVFPDDVVHRDVIRRCGGTALELGTGNGRFLIPALEEGLAVEGLDNSADILAICQQHADERGLAVTLHESDMAPLALDRQYRAIVCPAGSFSLVTDVALAHQALRSYHDHLEPGGRLAVSLYTVTAPAANEFVWRLRRTGTDPHTGETFIVHEAVGRDLAPQTLLTYNRLERFDNTGRLLDSELRKICVRWWERDEFTAALIATGFAEPKILGDADGWVALTRRA